MVVPQVFLLVLLLPLTSCLQSGGAPTRPTAGSSGVPTRRTAANRREVLFGMPFAASAAANVGNALCSCNGLLHASCRRAMPLAVAAGSAFQAQQASAVCSCPRGFDSCVCTDQPAAAPSARATVKRLDAAGRDAAESKADIAEMRGQARGKGGGVELSKPIATQTQTPVMAERGGLSGGGSLNYNEIDAKEAKRRFLSIVAETVAKREADYGFELDLDDIKQVESVLRVKYCGPQGLIGPC